MPDTAGSMTQGTYEAAALLDALAADDEGTAGDIMPRKAPR